MAKSLFLTTLKYKTASKQQLDDEDLASNLDDLNFSEVSS